VSLITEDLIGCLSRRFGFGLFIAAFGLLSACGGITGERSGPALPAGSSPPSLTFSASPSTVSSGGSSTLSWSASGVTSCEASGAWSGSKAVSGSQQIGPIGSTQEYRLSCSGADGGVSRAVTVTVNGGDSPRISLRADPAQIPVGGSSTLIWSVELADECSATGGWSGSRPLSGTFGTGPLQTTTSYGLSCSGSAGNALQSITVEVLDKVLRWQAPSQNVDGSPLTDLAGYVIYWGTGSRSYSSSFRINDPFVTEWEANIAPGTYYFAMTAVDTEGNESGYSNEVRKTIL
jgi:hypothetical protein